MAQAALNALSKVNFTWVRIEIALLIGAWIMAA